jgi:putative CocE/NonD family hydrolase
MRDGVELSADIYLPPSGDGPWPAILQRTPYDNTLGAGIHSWPAIGAYYAARGYVLVSQDVRGRGDSDGAWEPFVNEGPDGYDTIEWVAAQPWCDGKVGFMGVSYGGWVQWAAAREQPPHLTAMVSTAAGGRWMEEIPYRFGIMRPYMMHWLNGVGGRTLQTMPIDWAPIITHRPLRDLDIVLGRTNTVWRTYLEHETFDDYYRQMSLLGHFHKIDVPVLHITGWFDGDQWGELFFWHGMINESPAAEQQWLLVGPWNHVGTALPVERLGERNFGPAAVPPLDDIHLRFFDHWLKGIDNGAGRDRRVRLFVMGPNEWRDADEWPPTGTRSVPLYLHSGGNANTMAGDGTLSWEQPGGDEPADRFTYDPDDPTPSYPHLEGWPRASDYPFLGGPADNRWRLGRDDVLVYTSEPQEQELEMTGHPYLVLYAVSDCPDTDWHVTLCDVLPDGSSHELSPGRLRAAHRDGLEATPSPIEPGKVYEYRLELMAISNVWKKGHRIRVTVASASFPDSRRNPNTNARTGDDDTWQIAHNAVCHTAAYPSHLLAPVAE